MCRPSFAASCLAAFFGLGAASLVHGQCTLQMLAAQDGKIDLAAQTISLGEADDASRPTAWQGPLQAGACSFDIGIIEQPIALAPGQLLYVTTYSGSMRMIRLFDLRACSIKWSSKPFAGQVRLTPTSLTMGARKLRLDKHCIPTSTGVGRNR
jgi:hypothetical protein